MPQFKLAVDHHRTLEEARARLVVVETEVRAKFGPLVQRVEWSPDRDAMTLVGRGFVLELRVDERQVHVTGDVPLLGSLLSSPLAAGLKGIIAKAFPKSLP